MATQYNINVHTSILEHKIFYFYSILFIHPFGKPRIRFINSSLRNILYLCIFNSNLYCARFNNRTVKYIIIRWSHGKKTKSGTSPCELCDPVVSTECTQYKTCLFFKNIQCQTSTSYYQSLVTIAILSQTVKLNKMCPLCQLNTFIYTFLLDLP